jgi:hypothetical protein
MVRSRSDLLLTMKPGFRRKTMPVEVWEDEIQNLQLGEWRELNSGDEILSTLDQKAKQRGLRFCRRCTILWRRFRVSNGWKNLRTEHELRPHRTRPASAGSRTHFYSRGGICHGGGIGCDRACLHFWREVWLRRVLRLIRGQNAPARNVTFCRTLAFLSHAKAQPVQLSV